MVWIILVVILLIVFVLVGWFTSTYNGLLKQKMSVKNAFADMDAYLKKRYDLIPNLVETVKGYTKHESETLTAVIEARNKAMNSTDPSAKMEAEDTLSKCVSKLIALQEAYPELKAEKQFTNLSTQLEQMEKDILNSRRYYNAVVTKFNTAIATFPNVIVANMCHYTEEKLFEIANEERQNAKVQF